MNFDFSNVPDFAKNEKKSKLIWDGAPLRYRFNAVDGIFYCGDQIFASLQMQILLWRWDEGARHRYENQFWLDLLFVDKDSVVSLLCLNKGRAESIAAFLKLLQRPDDFAIKPHAVKVVLQSHLVQSLSGSYYSMVPASWEWVTRSEFDEAEAFLTKGLPRDPWVLTGENDVR